MDFIFGTFATDELKLVHHRAAHNGVQHLHRLDPVDPLPGEPVFLSVTIGIDTAADHVACYYTLDGSQPAGSRGRAQNGHVRFLEKRAVVWDAIAWGYVAHWQGELPPQPEHTVVRYRIGAWTDDGPEIFADWPVAQDVAEQAAAAFFRGDSIQEITIPTPGEGHSFSYHVDNLLPPAWARDAVIYEIFVDRFYPGDDQEWRPARDLQDIHGGTLWGVRDKLDYIEALGATCIWLTPIWKSPSTHGYDIIDYYTIEPRLGGEEALSALVEAAHQRGIRIVLDMVCNHISSASPVFQDALNSPNSPYRDWFSFDDSEAGYRTFFGVRSMPQINAENPAARQWLYDIAQYWINRAGVDGYRLDYANGPGPGFWVDFRAACRAANPESFCFGEIVDQPASILPYIGRLDGCLDFQMEEALRATFAHQTSTPDDFWRFVERHYAYFAQAGDFIMPTFIDNHDMDRFLYMANGDKTRLKAAAAAQMKLPQPPIIYYGTEVGLSQRADKSAAGLEVSREPMLWGDDQDQDLLASYRELLAHRR